MNILIFGGTQFFGLDTIELLLGRHQITIATRGFTPDPFGNAIQREICDRKNADDVARILRGKHYDVIIDKIAYSSNDIKRVLDAAECERYVHTSTAAVYDPLQWDTREESFDPGSESVIWCERCSSYGEVKRQAERAIVQGYPGQSAAFARFPVVLGKRDYTRRLAFYVEHVLMQKPMYIDNIDCRMPFISAEDAGAFLVFLAENSIQGGVNAACGGTISVREILEYLEKKSGKRALLSPDGDPAPWNGTVEHSLCTSKAVNAGFTFSRIEDWLFDLIDGYCRRI